MKSHGNLTDHDDNSDFSGSACHRDNRHTRTASEWNSFAQQERTLIALNLGVLATLLVIHVGFSSIVGSLSVTAYLLFCGRFVMQAVEWMLLSEGGIRGSSQLSRWYGAASIVLHIAFASLLSIVSEVEHSHYVVLMLIPIIAAAFRLPAWGVASTVIAASALAFVEVYLFYRKYPPSELAEYFEAATVSLVYAVAAAVVRLLVREVRDRERRLSRTLDELCVAQETLLQSERLAAVGRLSSSLAHEIRNPVSMIAASLRRARSGTGGRPVEELAAIAEAEASKLERITTDFLQYARTPQLKLRPHGLTEAAAAVVDLASGAAEESGVRLRVDRSGDDAVAVLCDPQHLYRAVLNLVRNAIEASPHGGEVLLRAAQRGAQGVLSVCNAGGPMPDHVVKRLYEPFVSNKPSGTGLGLSIARSIARAHGGDLILTDNTEQRVCFEIALPLEGDT